MTQRLQAKDIPDLLALCAVDACQYWCHEWSKPTLIWAARWDVAAMIGFPEKVVLAKLRSLMKRGLVSGCPCGCRGDLDMLPKGRAFLDGARK